MTELECIGDESSVLECRKNSPLGLHNCDHSKDAGVYCIGTVKIYLLCIATCYMTAHY